MKMPERSLKAEFCKSDKQKYNNAKPNENTHIDISRYILSITFG